MESPAPVEVVASDSSTISVVHRLIGDLRLLKSKRDGAFDVRKREALQCEIFRRFAVIDWVLHLAVELEGEAADEERGTDLQKLRDLVTAENIALKATEENLKAGAILPVPEVEPDVFFYYLDLPLRVRETVPSKLSNPQDKLNLVAAIPNENQLLRWNLDQIKAEQTIQLVMDNEERRRRQGASILALLDWQDLFNLSRVTPELSAAVKSYYESVLSTHFQSTRYSEFMHVQRHTLLLPAVERALRSTANDPEWCRLNPLPAHVLLGTQTPADEARHTENLAILRQVGSRIWDFSLGLQGFKEMPELLLKLGEILSLLPNLRLLNYSQFQNSRWDDLADFEVPEDVDSLWAGIKDIQLPKLKALKILKIYGDTSESEVIQRKLIQSYGERLVYLELNGGNAREYPMSGFQHKFASPALTSFKVDFGSQKGLDHFLPYLSMFQDAVLMKIHLNLGDPNHIIGKRYPELLVYLSNNFGATLEDVTIFLMDTNTSNDPASRTRPTDISPTWMMGVNFPKLKTLTLDVLSRPDAWTYLLLFPALEILTFRCSYRPMISSFREERILELSFDWDGMLKSNVWKLLPRLNVFEMKYIMTNLGADAEMGKITRQDCIRHQEDKF